MMMDSKLLKGFYERMSWYDGGFETFKKYHDVQVPMQVGCLLLAVICDQGPHRQASFGLIIIMVPCEYLPTFKHFLSLITFHNKLQLPAILHPLTIDLNKHNYALLLLSPLVFLVLTL